MRMDLLDDFIDVLNAVYGVYLDSVKGFSRLKSHLEAAQAYQLEINRKLSTSPSKPPNRHYNLLIEDFDKSCIIYSRPGENEKRGILHYCVTQAEFKRRNSPGGKNYRFIGNMALISIYQYWEDHFRKEIAAHFGVNKNDVRSPVMGDLRLLRQSIVHHNGIALKEVERCEIFKWYKQNDEIFIDEEKMEIIVITIKIKKLKNELFSIEDTT